MTLKISEYTPEPKEHRDHIKYVPPTEKSTSSVLGQWSFYWRLVRGHLGLNGQLYGEDLCAGVTRGSHEIFTCGCHHKELRLPLERKQVTWMGDFHWPKQRWDLRRQYLSTGCRLGNILTWPGTCLPLHLWPRKVSCPPQTHTHFPHHRGRLGHKCPARNYISWHPLHPGRTRKWQMASGMWVNVVSVIPSLPIKMSHIILPVLFPFATTMYSVISKNWNFMMLSHWDCMIISYGTFTDPD